MTAVVATIDAKGRISLPRDIRETLGVAAGDAVFLQVDPEHHVVHLVKAINPLDVLAELANQEFERGETTSLRDFAKEMGITLDEQ